MPALSSTMREGKIVSWSKSEGDLLRKGESVVVVESDKADMDVETFYDGILAAIVVPEGESAPVGAPIAILAESEEEVSEAKFLFNIMTSEFATLFVIFFILKVQWLRFVGC
ncbi:Dihydrolipoyllysine-residue acetyltransferase component 5 of pyruvate dehydrogenase complex chloroplastic [Bienertia sinuspersici]